MSKTDTRIESPSPEILRVEEWRRTECERAGAPKHLADLVAKNPAIDLHEYLDLLVRGCDPDTAYLIRA